MAKDSLEKRIDVLYEALGRTRSRITDSVRMTRTELPNGMVSLRTDFSGGASSASLDLDVSALVASIACLRDHLNVWLDESGKAKTATQTMGSNTDTAIIHDLWNRDKHSNLTKSSSGIYPSYRNVRRVMSSSSAVMFIVNPATGSATRTKGDAETILTADVVDKNGKLVGHLHDIAERAVAVWDRAFRDAGVPTPPKR